MTRRQTTIENTFESKHSSFCVHLLSDENFDGKIIKGLFLRQSDLDLARVQDVSLQELDDLTILVRAADNNRIVITHDLATMPNFAYKRLARKEPMPGLFVASDRILSRQIIEDVLLLRNYTELEEWNERVYLPL